jgi:hypothetical protein
MRGAPWKPDEQHPGRDTPRVVRWLDAMRLLVDAAAVNDNALARLLACWESGAWRDEDATMPGGRMRQVRLTPAQRGEVRELARRAVAARGGRYEVVMWHGPYLTTGMVVLADERGIRVTLPTLPSETAR